jgi:Bax protein
MQAQPEQRRAFLVFSLIVATLFTGAFHIQHPQPILKTLVPQVADIQEKVQEKKSRPVKLPNFAAIRDTDRKKKLFFDFLQPYVDQKNLDVQRQRQHLLGLIEKLRAGYVLGVDELVFLRDLSHEYEVPTDNLQDQTFLQLLLHRVDVLPPSLVLAQAANESGWGTSRFAREGFNFFGQWCFEEGCGLVPDRRRPSDKHEVKSFASVEEAVHAYFRNLNTFPSYQGLRRIRQDLRDGAKPIDGISLSKGLRSYSERGDAYITELRRMIEHNDLLNRDEQLVTLY